MIFANDESAYGFTRGVKAGGLRVPTDISVTGFDRNLFSLINDPMLTTLDQNVGEIAEYCVDALFKRINGVDVPSRWFYPELVIGESTSQAPS